MAKSLSKIIVLAGLLSATSTQAQLNEYDLYTAPNTTMHTEMDINLDLYVRGNKEINFNDLMDVAKGDRELIRVMLPGGLSEISSDNIRNSFFQDLGEIVGNLETIQNNPANAGVVDYPVDQIPIENLIQALEDDNQPVAMFYAGQIATHFQNLQQEFEDAGMSDELNAAMNIQSRTLEELRKVNPFLFDPAVWDEDGWVTQLVGRASFSLNTSMIVEDDEGNIATLEQHKGIRGKGSGSGGITYDFSAIENSGMLGEINLQAQYNINKEWTEEDAVQFLYNNFGIGFNQEHFEKSQVKHFFSLFANEAGSINLDQEHIDTETVGNSSLAHISYDRKGKLNLFLNLGYKETTSTLTDNLEETETVTETSELMPNLFLSHTDGNYTPFVSLKNGQTNYGLFVNSKFLTGQVNKEENLEFFVKLGTRDEGRVLDYMQQIEKLKHIHYPGSENKINKLRERMNRELRGVMLRYAQNLEQKEYSILLGKGKFTLEAGQTIDDWVTTNFVKLNMFNIDLSLSTGKDTVSGLTTRNYKINLPTFRMKNLGTMFLEVEHEAEERHPNMNYRIGFTKLF